MKRLSFDIAMCRHHKEGEFFILPTIGFTWGKGDFPFTVNFAWLVFLARFGFKPLKPLKRAPKENNLLILVLTVIGTTLTVTTAGFILWVIGTFFGLVAQIIVAVVGAIVLVFWTCRQEWKERKNNG